MAEGNFLLFAFNRGVIDKASLSRVDLERMALSAEQQTNWMPKVLGPMSLRAGLQYTGATLNNLKAFHIDFIYSNDDTAIIEVTSAGIRVKLNEVAITRPTVTSTVTNGNFTSDVASWTDSDESGATSAWETGGYLALQGNGTNYARRRQQVAVTSVSIEHALTLTIERGDVTLKVGSSAGASDYVYEEDLGKGVYSIAFTPTGDFHIELSTNQKRKALVNSIQVASAGDMVLPSPYSQAKLKYLRYETIFDVTYLWCDGYQQRKFERRGQRSWGIVLYQPEDGPFRPENLTNVTITPSALSGNITLAASQSLFDAEMVGSIFKITSVGQRVETDVIAENTFSNSIRINGADNARIFSISREGTWVATVTLQRSIGDESNWQDVTTYTTNATITYDDTLDNQIVYYRIGVKTGDFTSGTVELTLVYTLGESSGVARITGYTSSTLVDAEVLEDLGGINATLYWNEGSWSEYRGYPGAGGEFEGRLFNLGRGKQWASVADTIESHDDTVEGDSKAFEKSLGAGSQDIINWTLGLQRLIIGGELSEKSNRSTSFDEPLTPTNCTIKTSSTRGSNYAQAVNLDNDGIFANRTGKQLILLSYKSGGSTSVFDYGTDILNKLSRDILSPKIARIAIQREPDTRIHCLLEDGTVAVLVFDDVDSVSAWVKIETDGVVDDILVMPGDEEDNVYYQVARTIGGITKRYLERFSIEAHCIGGQLNRQADSFVIYDGTATAAISGLDHLEGEDVIVWADGRDLSPDVDGVQKTYRVSSGSITLEVNVTQAIIGLPYRARYKSSKLAYAASKGTALNQRKKVYQIGLTLVNTHYQGLKYGYDFDALDPLPRYEQGALVEVDTVHAYYDEDTIEFPGEWDTDSRICLEANAPRPATVCSISMVLETND